MEYVKRKKIDNNKYYLFKSGMFYIFIDDDAIKISKITVLKLTSLNNDIVKSGFPSNSLDKYMDVFKNLGLDIEIVERIENDGCCNNNEEKVIRKIRKLNLDYITPFKALNILCDMKELLSYE